jgi:transcriptional regulator with XRE-family HTH domain
MYANIYASIEGRTDVPASHDLKWGRADARRLRSAREVAGHTQKELAMALVHEFGLHSAPAQGTVSRWLRGDMTPRPDQRAALQRYVEAHGPTDDGPSSWPDLAAIASDEPLLGPRQGEFVNALIQRIGAGPPMTQEDIQVVTALAHQLGLNDFVD